VARREPEESHATDFTSFSCPSNVAMQSHSIPFDFEETFQMEVVASKLADARNFPSGDHAILRTVL